MDFDSLIHMFLKHKDGLKWMNFPKIGCGERYFDYYYAERGLYVIRYKITGALYFLEAASPKEAFMKLKKILDDAI